MWKENSKKNCVTAAVRPYNGKVFANVPRDVLQHLGAKETSYLVFKLRSNKTVSIKLFKIKKERLLAFKPLPRRKQFPPLSAFQGQGSR